MDCAICYDTITQSTGKMELSCSHSFHFSCLTTWFATQNANKHPQSCPCCRHKSNEHEKMSSTFIYDEKKCRERDHVERDEAALQMGVIVLDSREDDERRQENIETERVVARWF